MSLLDGSAKLKKLLDSWKDVNRQQHPPTQILDEISTLLEKEASITDSNDPDPFDERQTHRDIIDEPDSTLKHLLKTINDFEDLKYKLCKNYICNRQNDFELNCAAARLIINMEPIIPHNTVFIDMDFSVPKFLEWAKEAKEPLRTYSCALLVKAMKLPTVPAAHMTTISELVRKLIIRLQHLSKISDLTQPCIEDFSKCPEIISTPQTSKKTRKSDVTKSKPDPAKTPTSSRKRKYQSLSRPTKLFQYDKANTSLKPLTVGKQQDLILRFLCPISEYQELLPIALELNVFCLIFYYIDYTQQTDSQLACSALMYLSSLLCHKKFIVEFINRHGVQKMLEIPQPSSVATMSSLCLYYMVYNQGNEDCVERIFAFPHSTLHRLVEYLLMLTESSHVSGRCHASLFFSLTFSFKGILQLFDSMDGLRKIINLISTLKIMRSSEFDLATDDDVYLDHEIAKNTCQTLKKYFEAHVTIIANDYKNAKNSKNLPKFKSLTITPESLGESFETIVENTTEGLTTSREKSLVKRIISLEIPQLLLQLIPIASDRKNYENRVELLVTTLDTLLALSTFKEVALAFCQKVTVNSTESPPGIGILLSAIEGTLETDIHVRKAALKVICNCVISRNSLIGNKKQNSNQSNPLFTVYNQNMLIEKIWSSFRSNNGIMILLSTLKIKSPMIEADSIRALVCKALYGLAENKLICQILGKLPIFHNEQLQILMKEPILSDRISEHLLFCKYASLLMERVTGKPATENYNKAQAGVISQTRITYSQKELLQIVYKHLMKTGLNKAAETLKQEAELGSTTTSEEKTMPGTPSITIPKDVVEMSIVKSNHTPAVNKTFAAVLGSTPFTSPQTERRVLFTPKRKLSLFSPSIGTPQFSPAVISQNMNLQRYRSTSPPPPTLDNIVTSYLREQHAKCTNPVATCPPFSLFRPHNCPKPKYRQHAPANITKRLFDRQRSPPFGGLNGRKHNRKFIFSKFRPGPSYKGEDENMYTSCSWMHDTGSLAFGTASGSVKIVNYLGQDELVHNVHENAVIAIESSKDCKLIATSSDYGHPSAAVWKVVDSHVEGNLSLDVCCEMAEDVFLKFSNSQDRIIGTNDVTANVYDLTSGQQIASFFDPNNVNNYLKNVACFSPCDNLLLNDGVLWDAREHKLIHKFDKFNENISGTFHPAGREIIINAEVDRNDKWDLRTFHLLHTFPALENCHVKFSELGDVIYAVKLRKRESYMENSFLGPFESSFRTFDAHDYSALGTVDTKKIILDICPDPLDQCLAILEDDLMERYEYDTTCRLYNIGRTKRYGEEESDGEENEGEEAPHSSAENDDDQDDGGEREDLMEFFSNYLDGGDNDDDEDDDGDDDDDEDGWIDMDDDEDTDYDDDVY